MVATRDDLLGNPIALSLHHSCIVAETMPFRIRRSDQAEIVIPLSEIEFQDDILNAQILIVHAIPNF